MVKDGQNDESWSKWWELVNMIWKVEGIIHHLSQAVTRNQTGYDPCTKKSNTNGGKGENGENG